MTVGDHIKIVYSPDSVGEGETGTIIEIEGSQDNILNVEFSNGDTWWFCLDDTEVA